MLLKFLKENLNSNNKGLIFCQTKKGADLLSKSLRYEGWPNDAIHGDKS